MTQVAIETSARPPSVAVRVGERVEATRLATDRRHASDLLPSLERTLASLGSRASDIETVVVGIGPGSYTGLRVGVATALGLARGTGAKLFAVPSLDALAFAELAPGERGSVLLDARAGALYLAGYERLERDVRVLVEPAAITADELRDKLPSTGPIFGDASVADAARLDDAQRERLVTDRVPGAEAVLALGLERLQREGPTPPEELEPLYLRPFVARTRRR